MVLNNDCISGVHRARVVTDPVPDPPGGPSRSDADLSRVPPSYPPTEEAPVAQLPEPTAPPWVGDPMPAALDTSVRHGPRNAPSSSDVLLAPPANEETTAGDGSQQDDQRETLHCVPPRCGRRALQNIPTPVPPLAHQPCGTPAKSPRVVDRTIQIGQQPGLEHAMRQLKGKASQDVDYHTSANFRPSKPHYKRLTTAASDQRK
jgi:hypothetical protein